VAASVRQRPAVYVASDAQFDARQHLGMLAWGDLKPCNSATDLNRPACVTDQARDVLNRNAGVGQQEARALSIKQSRCVKHQA
jgi:hypothetical protein